MNKHNEDGTYRQLSAAPQNPFNSRYCDDSERAAFHAKPQYGVGTRNTSSDTEGGGKGEVLAPPDSDRLREMKEVGERRIMRTTPSAQ